MAAESILTISAPICSATSTASSLLPDAVGPTNARTLMELSGEELPLQKVRRSSCDTDFEELPCCSTAGHMHQLVGAGSGGHLALALLRGTLDEYFGVVTDKSLIDLEGYAFLDCDQSFVPFLHDFLGDLVRHHSSSSPGSG